MGHFIITPSTPIQDSQMPSRQWIPLENHGLEDFR